MNILLERPAGMSFSRYRAHLKEQSKWLKRRKKGVTIWHSNGVINREALEMQKIRPHRYAESITMKWIVYPEGTARRHQLAKRTQDLLKSDPSLKYGKI